MKHVRIDNELYKELRSLAFKNEMSSFKDIKNRFTRAKDVLNRKGMKVGAENRLAKGKKNGR